MVRDRRFLPGLAVVWAMAGTLVQAEVSQDDVVAQLTGQGFSRIEITRTWLGRVRIVATDEQRAREIVLNPADGTILRDRWMQPGEERPQFGILAPPPPPPPQAVLDGTIQPPEGFGRPNGPPPDGVAPPPGQPPGPPPSGDWPAPPSGGEFPDLPAPPEGMGFPPAPDGFTPPSGPPVFD